MVCDHAGTWSGAARSTAEGVMEKRANRLRRSAEDFVMGVCDAGVDRSIRSSRGVASFIGV